MTKTNAMRLLDAAGIAYRTAEYEYDESDLSGKHAAQQVGLPEEQVFKTLVTRGDKTGLLVFCIPVSDELDLRRAASVSGNKKLEMIHVKELLPLTGYIRGGCSPIGMKKKYPTYIDETSILSTRSPSAPASAAPDHPVARRSRPVRRCESLLKPHALAVLSLIGFTLRCKSAPFLWPCSKERGGLPYKSVIWRCGQGLRAAERPQRGNPRRVPL